MNSAYLGTWGSIIYFIATLAVFPPAEKSTSKQCDQMLDWKCFKSCLNIHISFYINSVISKKPEKSTSKQCDQMLDLKCFKSCLNIHISFYINSAISKKPKSQKSLWAFEEQICCQELQNIVQSGHTTTKYFQTGWNISLFLAYQVKTKCHLCVDVVKLF